MSSNRWMVSESDTPDVGRAQRRARVASALGIVFIVAGVGYIGLTGVDLGRDGTPYTAVDAVEPAPSGDDQAAPHEPAGSDPAPGGYDLNDDMSSPAG